MKNAMEFAGTQSERHRTSAGDVYEVLRDGLIWGRWQPGEKLKPMYLKSALECSSSVLREALIRLGSEGFVQFEEQRGFSVILPTKQSMLELRNLRLLLEVEGARLSIKNGGVEWEVELSAAHSRLVHLEERMRCEEDICNFIKIWSRHDLEFHAALIASCGSQHLQQIHKATYDKYRLHVISELRNYGFRAGTTIDEHDDILTSALDRDFKSCKKAIETHLTIYRKHPNE